MSIYNMIASIVGGGGGIAEIETDTFTGDGSMEHTVTYANAHTTPPDIVTYNIGDLTNPVSNCDLIAFAVYYGNDNIPAPYDPNHTYNIDESVFYSIYYVKPNYSPNNYGWILDEQSLPETYTNTFVMLPCYMGFLNGASYTWEAIWLDGSSSGGGGGGGGSSMNVQTNQTTSRISSTTLTSVNSLTCSTAGTYDVYWTCSRSSTSGTWSSQLYVNGTASGSEQTTWSNHVQTVHLTGVTIGANQTVAVYVKARGTNYYGYCPQLTIVQTS